MQKIISVLFVVTLLTFSNSLAQTTYEFLRIDMSARAAALGGSFVSNHDDVDVIFYNPAGTQFLENSPISFSFVYC